MTESKDIKAVLIERNYKGYLERYALTVDEFKERFGYYLQEDMSMPQEGDFDTYTLSPLVQIGYCLTTVGSWLWNTFFTDMSWGLCEDEIAEGNLAYIRESFCKSLRRYVEGGGIPHTITIHKLLSAREILGYRVDVRDTKGIRLVAFDLKSYLLHQFVSQLGETSVKSGRAVRGFVSNGRFISENESKVIEVSEESITDAIKMYRREVRKVQS